MIEGTNAPSDEVLHKWFHDINRFPEQVNNLDKEQLNYLNRYLPMVNNEERKMFHHHMSDALLAKVKKVRDEELKLHIKENNRIIDKELYEDYNLTREYLDDQINEMQYFLDMGIFVWFGRYNSTMDAPGMCDVVLELENQELTDMYFKDRDHRSVERLVLERIENIKEEEQIDSGLNYPKVNVNVYVFIYVSMRFLSKDLNLRLNTYKNPKEAGKIIAKTLYDSMPNVNRWKENHLKKYSLMLYRYAFKKSKSPIWEIPEDDSDFSDRFKSVRELNNEELIVISKWLLSQIMNK